MMHTSHGATRFLAVMVLNSALHVEQAARKHKAGGAIPASELWRARKVQVTLETVALLIIKVLDNLSSSATARRETFLNGGISLLAT